MNVCRMKQNATMSRWYDITRYLIFQHTFHRSSPPPLFSIFFRCITCNTGENAGLSCDPFIRNMAEMALGVSDMIRRVEKNNYCVSLFLCDVGFRRWWREEQNNVLVESLSHVWIFNINGTSAPIYPSLSLLVLFANVSRRFGFVVIPRLCC